MIGEGAFSKVYLAKKKSDNSKCVIKIYEKSRVTTEERKRSLKRELEALNISKHKNLVNAIDNYETSDSIAIVMEYFSDVSLTEFCKNSRPIEN